MQSRREARRFHLLGAAVVTLLLVAGSAFAAIAWQATSASTFVTSVTHPPVRFDDGNGAHRSRHVTDYAPTANRTGFSATIHGRAGAQLVVNDVVRVTNVDDETHNVTLHATGIDNPNIEEFTWTVRSGGSDVGALNLLDVSPSLTFSLPANESFKLDVRLAIAKGAGKNNATQATNLWGTLQWTS